MQQSNGPKGRSRAAAKETAVTPLRSQRSTVGDASLKPLLAAAAAFASAHFRAGSDAP